VSTTAKIKRPKPKQAAQAWWAKAAYSGQDRKAALATLEASGIPLKPVAGSMGLLSAMARGDALMQGAMKIRPTRQGAKKPSAHLLRLLQWRLVMCYAGFEIFAKSGLGRFEHDDSRGLIGDDVRHLTAKLNLPVFAEITPPQPKAAIRKWLSDNGTSGDYSDIARFLRLNNYDKRAFLDWLHGTPITSHADACMLTKALRNATAHGFLSPTKCHSLGLDVAIRTLPRLLADIRVAMVCRLHEVRHPKSC
jgi:hypothetical protein